MSTIIAIIAIVAVLILIANLVFGALITLLTNPVMFLILLTIAIVVYMKIRRKIQSRKI